MRVLIDMNLSPRWAATLQNAGIVAAHWSSVVFPDAPDSEIMDYAHANRFVILTQDLDFGIMLAITRKAWPSVVQLRTGNARPEIIGDLLVRALKQMSSDLEAGALVTIDPTRTRLRLLPLPTFRES